MDLSRPPLCQLCGEPMLEGEALSPSIFNGKAVHHECGFRAVAGGANHCLGLCGCYGGTLPPDPPGLSKREAARAAIAAFESAEGRAWYRNKSLRPDTRH